MRLRVVIPTALLAGCTASPGGGTGDGSTGEPATTSTASMSTASSSATASGSTSTSGSSDASTTAPGESSTTSAPQTLDEILAELLAMQEVPVVPLEPPRAADPDMVALGEALFFDPILSGNKDVACASCHHPSYGTSDGLSLTLGTGAVGTGPERAEGAHPPFVPRNAQNLFNLGHPDFVRMFWDGRVELVDDALVTPAGADLLPGVDSPLAAQAMFPVLDRLEMRGEIGDMTVLGESNELADLDDADPQAIWAALMARLEGTPEYLPLFDAAFDGADFSELTFADAANAIAAYEATAFSFPAAPWDDYLRGDLAAISDAAKLGAIIFYGGGNCSLCHSGPLLTDHEFHNTAVPQLGPGKAASAPFDHGRELVTGDPADRFRFRTPSLRNVEVSAPYMHDGAHIDFEDILRHYGDVTNAIETYDPAGLLEELQPTVQQGAAHIMEINAGLSEELNLEPNLAGLSNIREFLLTLTDPAVHDLPDLRPASVPSGLDVP